MNLTINDNTGAVMRRYGTSLKESVNTGAPATRR